MLPVGLTSKMPEHDDRQSVSANAPNIANGFGRDMRRRDAI